MLTLTVFLEEIIILAMCLLAYYYTKNKKIILVIMLLFGFIIYFNRPNLDTIKTDDSYIVSPAEGKIIKIEKSQDMSKIYIYLNLFNKHRQYSPYNGYVKSVRTTKGFFKKAYDPDASRKNSKKTIILDTKIGEIVVELISGKYVRKIVSVVKPRQYIKKASLLGMIKFGSLVTISIHNSKIDILKKVGEEIVIGEPVAMLMH